MDEQGRGRTDRPGPYALALAWLALGTVVVGQVQLPRPARSATVGRPTVVGCWLVRVATRPAAAPSLQRDLRLLRRAGLVASLRPGRMPGSRELVVLARSPAGVRAARDRAVRLGLPRGTVRRMPRAACRR
jgi:hypothetical protein